MKPEDFITDDFLKQFKTGKELNEFLAQIQKRGIEKMLEGELDSHLGYDKHEQTQNDNSRNGYGKKRSKRVMEHQKYKCLVIGMQALTR